jgi:hypothetical protein
MDKKVSLNIERKPENVDRGQPTKIVFQNTVRSTAGVATKLLQVSLNISGNFMTARRQ